MKTTGIVAMIMSVLLVGCTTTGTPTQEDPEPHEPGYAFMDSDEIVLADAEEDWCTTLEGSAGAWLAANDHDLIVDASSGEPNSLDQETVRLLEIVASDGPATVTPDEFEQLDTFLSFPIPSPLACRTAFETRDD